MIIKNLLLKFDQEQDGKLLFLTDNNFSVSLPTDLFPADFNRQGEIYLSVDSSPLLTAIENKKELLNELLNSDDK